MSTFDYILDTALVLLVLLQIKERPMTMKQLVRPLVILGIAVVSYFHNLPTQGNDLVLIVAVAALGGVIGVASGFTAIMRNRDGVVTLRSGWLSGFFWVLGMGLRFAFAVWISHGGVDSIASFSATHHITGSQVWTDALLGMAVFEIVLRTAIVGWRWKLLQSPAVTPVHSLA